MALSEITHYRIVRQLGAGGMGEVFLAEDTTLDRKVAIKMLPDKWAADSQARQRLLNEAKAVAALDHPNICSIYEVGEDAGRMFIVMQYIEGLSLAEKIAQNPLTPGEVVDIGIQTAEALTEAHSRGIIHRDIKPQNVIITPRGQLKVLDFGLARFALGNRSEGPDTATWARLTETGAMVGTPGFMSPEQLQGKEIDARSDIFSLGVMLYECATGGAAFKGATPIEVSLRVITQIPPPISELNPAVPQSLGRIISKAMAKDPAERYESAAALQSDLRKLQQGIGSSPEADSRPASAAQAAPDPERTVSSASSGRPRSLRFKASIAAIVVATIVAIGFGVVRFRTVRHVPQPEAVQWYDRGTSAIREGAYFQASKALERALEIDRSFALAHARLAEAYAELELTDKARDELLQAIALVPDRSVLSDAESLYLDAVAATLNRDFDSAIQKYSTIVDSVRDSDKSVAYVDLGRAYEKKETVDKAIESYLKATELAPQSAAGFLHSGILYGRRQELSKANEAFARAENIYQAMSSQEGLADVYYQRGSVLAKIRNVPEAKSQLERALEISRSSSNQYQLIRTQLQLSSVYYAEGDTNRAKKIALDAIEAAQSANIRALATNGLIDLGYTLLSRGEFVEAHKYFQQALDFARQDRATRTEARARLALGSLRSQEGNFDEAIPLLEAALNFYKPAGYRKEASNALILLGRAHREKGEYDVALKAFSTQLEMARQSGDAAQVAATQSSIGVLLGFHQELYAESLPHLDESYGINQSLGAKVGMGWDQMNRAATLWPLGRYREAKTALDEAYSIANQPEAGFKSQLAWVQLTAAQMALSMGARQEAITKARAALELAGKEYEDVALQAKQTIAVAQALSGGSRTAVTLGEEAVASAKELRAPRLISSALLACAEVQLNAGDAPAALEKAQAAQTMFASAGQLESEWHAWLVAARALRLAGDRSATYDYAHRAESQRSALESRWGAENYRTYSLRPDIQVSLKQLRQLIANQ